MKRLKILLLAISSMIAVNNICGQGFIITYSGAVQDAATNDPVPFHPVDIFANSQLYLKTIYTDETGIFRDSLVPSGDTLLTSLRFATIDCMQQTVDTTVVSLNELIFVTLRICVDTIPENCQAEFLAVLDSTLNVVNQYQFLDQSTGSIDAWLWNFGDGTFSNEQNPVHQYQMPGTYQVCLTVTSSANPAGCSDTECQLIITPQYYNFGGMTYLGDIPMNNPVNVGDTGIAYLYRVFEQQLVPVDMKSFVDYGYYWFSGVLEGQYVVRISLSQGSVHYQDYFPAYSGGSVSWEAASTFNLDDSTFFDANIHLPPVPSMPAGTGMISGFLIIPGNDLTAIAVDPDPVVLLCDDAGNPLNFRHPATDGSFMFTGLPAGNYILKADVTGYLSQAVNVSLVTESMVQQGIELNVTVEGTFGIDDHKIPGTSAFKLYPNPAPDILYVDFQSKEDSRLRFVAVDLLGRKYPMVDAELSVGRNSIMLDVRDLPRGMYILGIAQRRGGLAIAGKFIH